MNVAVSRLVHSALEPAATGSPLGEAAATDRAKVGVLLQAAALLAHLERAGWRLADGWDGARLDEGGKLRDVGVEPGRTAVPPEARLRQAVTLLFGGEEVAGRGAARRAVRRLMDCWRDAFLPTPAEHLPSRILSTAPFLFGEEGASARTALIAMVERDGREDVWLALPSRVRRRVRAEADDLGAVTDLLVGGRFAELWAGGEGDPRELAAAGRWAEAIRAWEASPPATPAESLDYAESLFAVGRFATALDVLKEVRTSGARCLALGCHHFLGSLEAGRRLSRKLLEEPLPEAELLRVAAFALRLHAALGDPDSARRWIERARRDVAPGLGWRVDLLAAEEAWDSGRRSEMADYLESARQSIDEPQRSRRWQQVAALGSLGRGDAAGVVRHTAAALAVDRRRVPAWEAANLWNDHAVGRMFLGDLAGAERACAHAARLMRESEGPRRDTLALRNLAEVRLRRGRLRGVREILERARARNRRDGNLRATAEDTALWARFELVQGRPAAAVETLGEIQAQLEEAGSAWHGEEIAVLEARALGWLNRPEEAGAALESASDDAVAQMLEAEERPALWALAGERDRALEVARELPADVRSVWEPALAGDDVPQRAWAALDAVEGYRSARWVWDLELVAPGRVPAERMRRAVEAFRKVGAGPLAEQLAARFEGPWEAIASFVGLESPDPAAVGRLLVGAGHGDARLVRRTEDDVKVLCDGPGGATTLAAPHGNGVLELSVDEGAASSRALLELVARLLPAPRASRGEAETILPGILGRSAAFREALAPLAVFSRGTMPVLVLGETGTGKELVARQVHRLGPRADGPFVVFDCTTISDTLGLSQLFGHVRGAFTGADRDRMGPFELARGGTIFLDEIGELPPAGQAMLLRVLQEGEIVRVGESLPRKVDVWVVAATHRDLAAEVRAGSFREDLFFRLSVAEVMLPPLRERRGDVELLTDAFLARFAREYGERAVSAEARKHLEAHPWPGNVRELEGVVHRAAALAREGTIHPEHLRLRSGAGEPPGDYHRRIEDYRRELVRDALRAAGGNRSQAARVLGITRQALSYLVKQLEIEL